MVCQVKVCTNAYQIHIQHFSKIIYITSLATTIYKGEAKKYKSCFPEIGVLENDF